MIIMNDGLYAVITGDLIDSSKFVNNEWQKVAFLLYESFRIVENETVPNEAFQYKFEIYRGDSFQGVLKNPEFALKTAITILTYLQTHPVNNKMVLPRLSIGIGTIDYFSSSDKISESDGEAFRNSGRILDEMKKKNEMLKVTTPESRLNDIFDVQCTFFDVLCDKWKIEDSEALFGKMKNLTQEQIAFEYGISQSAVSYRLKSAGYKAVKKFIHYYEKLFQNNNDLKDLYGSVR